MASSAVVQSTADIAWSDGSKFNGYALVMIVLPELGTGNYPEAALAAEFPKINIPVRFQIPIRDGVYRVDTKLLFNTGIEPPATKYVAYFLDINDAVIAGPTSLFTVTADPHTLDSSTLTIPTAETDVPTISDVSDAVTAGTILNSFGMVPVFGSPTGTKDGANVTFTLVTDPLANGKVVLFWNGIVLAEGGGFSRVGTTLTLDTAPASDDVLEEMVFVLG